MSELIAVLNMATKQVETINKLKELLTEWVYNEQDRPFFHEDEHGYTSLLNKTRRLLNDLENS